MNIIVCLDDKNGMLFNHRRQSMDQAVRQRILSITAGKTLWMNGYTAKQFTEPAGQIAVAEDFLSCAENDDFCFLEKDHVDPYQDKIQKIVVYRWNRVYPADTFFPAGYLTQRISTFEFPGNSHEKITEEVYQICEK